MNTDEAIIHAREVAKEQKRRSGICVTNDNECDKFSNCMKCAEEHEQLAEWLEELLQYREIGTPEECRKAVKRKKPNSRPCLTDEDSVTCGNCGSDVDVTFYEYTYCPHCGQRVR